MRFVATLHFNGGKWWKQMTVVGSLFRHGFSIRPLNMDSILVKISDAPPAEREASGSPHKGADFDFRV